MDVGDIMIENVELAQNEACIARFNGNEEVGDEAGDDPQGGTATGIFRVTPLPLPDGKEFHVFISHDSADRDFAVELLDILEAEPYTLKCCFADRDFVSGETVVDNIEKCMKKSSFVLFLLTPAFVDSHYCDFEKNVAQEIFCSGEPNFKIIPMLLKDCELPRSLRFINYIDARDKTAKSVVDKLYTAIVNGDTEIFSATRLYHLDLNGNKVVVATAEGPTIHQLNREVPEIPDDTKETCKQLGMKINDKICDEICYVVNQAPCLRYYSLLYSTRKMFVVWFSFTMLVIAISNSVVAAIFLEMKRNDNAFFNKFTSFSLLICPPFMALVVIIGVAVGREMVVIKTTEYMGKVSQHSYKRLKFLAHIGHDISPPALPTLHLVKYESEDCKKYIADVLLSHGEITTSTRQTEHMNEVADEIIYNAIPRYTDFLRKGGVGAAHPRHPVARDIMCLCQFIETNNLHIQTGLPPTRNRRGRLREQVIGNQGFASEAENNSTVVVV